MRKYLLFILLIINLSGCTSSSEDVQLQNQQPYLQQAEKHYSSQPDTSTAYRPRKPPVPYKPKEYYPIPNVVHDNMNKDTDVNDTQTQESNQQEDETLQANSSDQD